MTTLHHKRQDAALLLQTIETFLQTCRRPAVLEQGEDVVALPSIAGILSIRSERLWVEVASERRVLARRIVSIQNQRPGLLDCGFQKFGGSEGKLTFLDLDRPQTAHRQLSGTRQSFGQQFRRMLHRQFPQWEIAALSSSMDLRRCFSPVFPRARITRGKETIAAMACPAIPNERDLLTFALIWFDHVRQTGKEDVRTSLCLFLPDGAGSLTAHRLRFLRNEVLRPRVFRFNEHGSAGEVDAQDLGNVETRVSPRYSEPHLTAALHRLLNELGSMPHVSYGSELTGAISVRFRGAEFARVENGRLRLGLENRQEIGESGFGEVMDFARQLITLSDAGPAALPERWLEAAVRANVAALDPALQPEPLHGQVLTFAGIDRDALDLLAVSPDGRLSILELKASEDLHLPLQGLDYWIRIHWHAERNELDHLFPGMQLSKATPRLLLVAPAFSFHSSNATVLRYFSPEVEVERIGVNSEWQTRFKVVLRLSGADTPISHGRPYVV